MVKILFCLCLQPPRLLTFEVCLDILVVHLISVLCHLWTDEIKATHYEQISLEIKVYLARDIEVFVLSAKYTIHLNDSISLVTQLFEYEQLSTLIKQIERIQQIFVN